MSLKTRFATLYDQLDDYCETKAWYHAFCAWLTRVSLKHKAFNAKLRANNDRLRRRVSRGGRSSVKGAFFAKPTNAAEKFLLCWLSLLLLLLLIGVAASHLAGTDDNVSSPTYIGHIYKKTTLSKEGGGKLVR